MSPEDICKGCGKCCSRSCIGRYGIRLSREEATHIKASSSKKMLTLRVSPVIINKKLQYRRASHIPTVGETCAALTRNNLCSLYEHRPKICREYRPWKDIADVEKLIRLEQRGRQVMHPRCRTRFEELGLLKPEPSEYAWAQQVLKEVKCTTTRKKSS